MGFPLCREHSSILSLSNSFVSFWKLGLNPQVTSYNKTSLILQRKSDIMLLFPLPNLSDDSPYLSLYSFISLRIMWVLFSHCLGTHYMSLRAIGWIDKIMKHTHNYHYFFNTLAQTKLSVLKRSVGRVNKVFMEEENDSIICILKRSF